MIYVNIINKNPVKIRIIDWRKLAEWNILIHPVLKNNSFSRIAFLLFSFSNKIVRKKMCKKNRIIFIKDSVWILISEFASVLHELVYYTQRVQRQSQIIVIIKRLWKQNGGNFELASIQARSIIQRVCHSSVDAKITKDANVSALSHAGRIKYRPVRMSYIVKHFFSRHWQSEATISWTHTRISSGKTHIECHPYSVEWECAIGNGGGQNTSNI